MPTLNWIGKEAVVKHHKDVPLRLLEPVPELSCPDPRSGADGGNLIVQGDNLQALKALLPRYAADFVWFAETGTGYGGRADGPLLGVHEGRAVYLLYNGIFGDESTGGGNVLTAAVLDRLPRFDGPKVIYAAASRLGIRAARLQVTFKQTPYALET